MPANTYGRQVVIPLTNKSGGGVIAGDVVVIDTTNNEAFTTSTAGAVTISIGVAQETIASNAVGRVLVSGYAALVNVNASVTRGNYGKTHTVAKQATDAGASRVAGTFCQFWTGGTTPTAMVYPVDLAGAALTDPTTTNEDIIIRRSAALARLAIGAAGGALVSLNSILAYNSGTSMPANKATGDRYWRTDLGLEAYWDGTRWLSSQIFREPISVQESGSVLPISTNNTVGYIPTWGTEYALYLLEFFAMSNVLTTNDGTKFWTVALVNDAGSTITSFTTAADTASTKATHRTTINALNASTEKQLNVTVTKTSTPGNIYIVPAVSYRLVLT